jgi:hypothetical protein
MLEAKLKCARSLAAPYSKKLAALNLTIKFWKIMKLGIKTKTDVSDILKKIAKEINNKSATTRQFAIKKHIWQAIQEYNKALPKAKSFETNNLWNGRKQQRYNATKRQHNTTKAWPTQKQ